MAPWAIRTALPHVPHPDPTQLPRIHPTARPTSAASHTYNAPSLLCFPRGESTPLRPALPAGYQFCGQPQGPPPTHLCCLPHVERPLLLLPHPGRQAPVKGGAARALVAGGRQHVCGGGGEDLRCMSLYTKRGGKQYSQHMPSRPSQTAVYDRRRLEAAGELSGWCKS